MCQVLVEKRRAGIADRRIVLSSILRWPSCHKDCSCSSLVPSEPLGRSRWTLWRVELSGFRRVCLGFLLGGNGMVCFSTPLPCKPSAVLPRRFRRTRGGGEGGGGGFCDLLVTCAGMKHEALRNLGVSLGCSVCFAWREADTPEPVAPLCRHVIYRGQTDNMFAAQT